MVFPGMLVDAAAKAGMKVPKNPDGKFSRKKYPHFSVFCAVQLCRPIVWGEHWGNAEIIAGIPDDEITKISLQQLLAKGIRYAQ